MQSSQLAAHGSKIKELLSNDKFVKKIQLLDDLSQGRNSGQGQKGFVHSSTHTGSLIDDDPISGNKER